ncbi:RM47, ribosomal protein 47 mitochondrial large ribosomal subunit, partial [Thalassiosira pseudonana CCMP1335]
TSPLDQFRDTVPTEKRMKESVGRSWSVAELRRKSYDDLHKLWYVLYKERNMLLTESNLARRHGYYMIQPERRRKVRKSMGAIKHVLGER